MPSMTICARERRASAVSRRSIGRRSGGANRKSTKTSERSARAAAYLLVKVHDLDHGDRGLQVLLREQRLGVVVLLKLHEVGHEHVEDRLRRVRHQDPPLKVRVPDEERHRRAVVEVEVRHEQRVHGGEVHLVEVRQRRDPGVPGVDAAVEHHGLALVRRHHARASDLGSRAERGDSKHVVALGVVADHFDGAFHSRGHLDRSRHDAFVARRSFWSANSFTSRRSGARKEKKKC
jgi:hypothetical protein